MNNDKKLGIWMDHASAHLIEFPGEESEKSVITSAFTHEEREQSLMKNENLMHNKEQHMQSEFYKKLGEVIKKFSDVLLFGPTDAKSELLNLLREDHLFSKIRIEVLPAGKMSGNQQLAFVKAHFSKS